MRLLLDSMRFIWPVPEYDDDDTNDDAAAADTDTNHNTN